MANPKFRYSLAGLIGLALASPAWALTPEPTASATTEAPVRIGVGAVLPSLMGDSFNTFTGKLGAEAEALLPTSILGNQFNWRGSLQYMRFGVTDISTATLVQINTFVGLETRPQATGLIRPLVSAEVGSQFNWLTFNTSSSIDNTKTALGLRFRAGFEVPLSSNVSLLYSMPLTVGFSTNRFTSLGAALSVRTSL